MAMVTAFLLTRPSRDVTTRALFFTALICISTHTSLAGRDVIRDEDGKTTFQFLLTRPSRDVTGGRTCPI